MISSQTAQAKPRLDFLIDLFRKFSGRHSAFNRCVISQVLWGKVLGQHQAGQGLVDVPKIAFPVALHANVRDTGEQRMVVLFNSLVLGL